MEVGEGAAILIAIICGDFGVSHLIGEALVQSPTSLPRPFLDILPWVIRPTIALISFGYCSNW